MSKKIKNPQKFKLVEIEWTDSMGPSDGGWICVTHDEFKEDYISSCYSCGYLIGETKKEYKICGSYHKRGEDSINTIGLLGIPKVAVVSIKKL